MFDNFGENEIFVNPLLGSLKREGVEKNKATSDDLPFSHASTRESRKWCHAIFTSRLNIKNPIYTLRRQK